MAARGWQHRAMRYEPSQRLLRLARHLAASRAGLTLDEIAAELEVGRRTAERLRDSLAAMFPQMECWDDDRRRAAKMDANDKITRDAREGQTIRRRY